MRNNAKKAPAGARRTSVNPPTVAEAILAARGLTDDAAEVVEIASQLMGVSPAEVAAAALHLGTPGAAKDRRTVAVDGPSPRTVVVERRRVRVVARR
jgi:hypothetical protein